MNNFCSQSLLAYTEGGNRQNRLHLENRTPSWARLWTLSYCPVSIPTGKPDPCTPQMEEPQDTCLDSLSLKEYPNYLCNRIESSILLCLLGYDHRPFDNLVQFSHSVMSNFCDPMNRSKPGLFDNCPLLTNNLGLRRAKHGFKAYKSQVNFDCIFLFLCSD